MKLVLGIDGGGTRTTAWLGDERGKILGKGVAGPSNPLKGGFEACEREILRAARKAVAPVYDRRVKSLRAAVSPVNGRRLKLRGAKRGESSAAIDRRYSVLKLDAVVLGLAGTDRPTVHRKIFAWLRKNLPARKHVLTSDAAIALHAAAGDSPGIIVISGTGSIAYAQDERRRVLRSGGWGTLYDDAGSGYDLGRRAIVAALQAHDGRGPNTLMLIHILAALRLKDITQVVLKPLAPHEIAALFPLVLEAEEEGDRVARRLCSQAGQELAELALALIRRLGRSRRNVPVVCSGGVFRSSAAIRRAFSFHLHRHAPQARVMLLRAEPVEGALALARDCCRGHEKTLKAHRARARR